jgi:CRISPR-associated protein Cmr2
MSNLPDNSSFQIAIAWCLAWGSNVEPRYPVEKFHRWRASIIQAQTPDDPEWQMALDQAEALTQFAQNSNRLSISEITALIARHPLLWESSIGLVYGGVTKVKSYVFESADLQEVRGASALLDRINLVDLPALFHAEDSEKYKLCQQAVQYCQHVRSESFLPVSEDSSTSISDALIPELIVYATGGNILAFCPAAFIDQLSNTIEKRYTSETLSANSCAVGEAFSPLEIYLGLLKNPIEGTLWHDAIATKHKANPVIQAYFGFDGDASTENIKTAFEKRKNFGELVGKLTNQFNQRRSGYDDLPASNLSIANVRPSRRYPPMFETHPYLLRDDSDIRSAVIKAKRLPDEPKLSEPTARKRRVGQITKRDDVGENWYVESGFKAHWNPEPTKDSEDGAVFQSWVIKFEGFLRKESRTDSYDQAGHLFNQQGRIKSDCKRTREARSLHEIGEHSNGYVAYIYADGNSMGRYIRKKIKTPAQYQQFSEDVFKATEESVYNAIADHLKPYLYTPDAKSSRQNKAPVWIHPFEIVAIGGDDVLLIVPANKALEVAQAIGQYFESLLVETGRYAIQNHREQTQSHRYQSASSPTSNCCLSTSSGVLITTADTPIYYADVLVSQLLKSAKQRLKKLNEEHDYYGGTVDFLVLKAVTMVSSDITRFRQEGLTTSPPNRNHTLKLYAAPYTLYELSGLIDTVKAFKRSGFPKSQLYQIRSLLERGKQTAILNYRYFRVRLSAEQQGLIKTNFEEAWCSAGTNNGNIAPWLTAKRKDEGENNDSSEKGNMTVYETIWRELVELEPFIEIGSEASDDLTDPVIQDSVQAQGSSL